MLYMSNDRNGIFETEQECLEYEQRIEQERVRKKKLEVERQNRLDTINKKYKDLQKDVSKFTDDYGIQPILFFSSFLNFLDMMSK